LAGDSARTGFVSSSLRLAASELYLGGGQGKFEFFILFPAEPRRDVTTGPIYVASIVSAAANLFVARRIGDEREQGATGRNGGPAWSAHTYQGLCGPFGRPLERSPCRTRDQCRQIVARMPTPRRATPTTLSPLKTKGVRRDRGDGRFTR
jgi:hypothetical protein